MMIVARTALCLGPVFAFLGGLVLLDTFKLVRLRAILQTVLAGCCAAVALLFLNRWLVLSTGLELGTYSKVIAPILEEVAKAVWVIYLIRANKIGFIVDAAILGFAVGAGFAFVENVYYLDALSTSGLGLWMLRGLGTAVMHGCTTTIFAILSKDLLDRYAAGSLLPLLPGLGAAIGIHAFFNQVLLPPVIYTVVQIAALPLVMVAVFDRSEKGLRRWLDVGLDTDVTLLGHINEGTVSQTKVGRYLHLLKARFPGDIVGDMLCLLRIHLELTVRAKGLLMMRQAGFPILPDPEVTAKFAELRYLERNVGKTGRLAIAPLLRKTRPDLWHLHMLKTSPTA
jgi:RsiW-degrading membrane proteinase PrsW (M82 family)